jgi:hypothetical protein
VITPVYLDKAVIEQKSNFSKLLQEALKQRLGL